MQILISVKHSQDLLVRNLHSTYIALITIQLNSNLFTVKLRVVSQLSRIFSVYEGEIWCLCTGTFGQKSSKLNSRLVYCSRLCGTYCLVRPSPSAFSIKFQKNSNVICFLWQENYMFITSQMRCHWNSFIIYVRKICEKQMASAIMY